MGQHIVGIETAIGRKDSSDRGVSDQLFEDPGSMRTAARQPRIVNLQIGRYNDFAAKRVAERLDATGKSFGKAADAARRRGENCCPMAFLKRWGQAKLPIRGRG